MREPLKKENEEIWAWNERYDNFKALATRCRIHQMTSSHKNADKFPYTAGQLALYMSYVCNQIKPVEDGDEPPI